MTKDQIKLIIEEYLETNNPRLKQQIEQWILKDPDLNKWMENRVLKESPQIDKALNKRIFEQIDKKTRKSYLSRTDISVFNPSVWRWVAIFIFPILSSLTVFFLMNDSTVEKQFQVITKRGEKAQILLPDSTVVNINSDSKILYSTNFGKNERRIKLQGEAYFDVTKNRESPFIVELDGLILTVLGTTFNVNAYQDSNEISVVLLNGKVNICTDNESVILYPDDRLVYNKHTGQINTKKVISPDYAEWTKGNLYFENESLENIVKVLSRTYNISIRIAPDTDKNQFFTGTIEGGDIRHALKILSLISPIEYEIKDSEIIIH